MDNKTYRLPPDVKDWWNWCIRQCGFMTVVKNQLSCDMCWAIVAADCASMGLKIMGIHSELIELSCKELLDCCNPDELNGTECYPYSLKKAFKFIRDHKLMREEDYPFKPEKSPCSRRSQRKEQRAVRIRGYDCLECEDELELMRAVMKYPIAAGLELTQEFFNLKGGIYKGPSQKNIEDTQPKTEDIKDSTMDIQPGKGKTADKSKAPVHAVLIMGFGYDEVEDTRYWLIKNSYGKEWGVNGYGRIARKSSLKSKKSLFVRAVKPLF